MRISIQYRVSTQCMQKVRIGLCIRSPYYLFWQFWYYVDIYFCRRVLWLVVHLCSKTFEKHLSAEESPDLRPSRIFAQVHGILMEMENVFPVKSFTKC